MRSLSGTKNLSSKTRYFLRKKTEKVTKKTKSNKINMTKSKFSLGTDEGDMGEGISKSDDKVTSGGGQNMAKKTMSLMNCL